MVGTVNLIHFGWVYQGLWQMCKLVLSNEAKAKVKFSTPKELQEYIDEQDLIRGENSYFFFLERISH